jgi:hypothetical protein
MSQSNDVGRSRQLPTADRNAELERRSFIAFQSALPVDKFVFRDERTTDAGVDGSLELLAASSYTNLRSQVQLKSTDSEDTNSDGSISIQVRATNLNYLLNGSNSPLYVLFVAPRGELRYAWAHDERRRLDEASPAWEQQESVTIRFREMMTPEAIEGIYQRIRQEAQLKREINDILGKATAAEQIVVSINPETLDVTDPDRAKRILLTSGTAIVSAGYTHQVTNLIRLLNPRDAQLPRILLVQAHAEHTLGRYQAAHALLADVTLRRDELSEDDQQFLEVLRDGCDYQTGRLSMSEFLARLDEHAKHETGSFALSYRLSRFRYTVISQPELGPRLETLQELRSLVTSIVEASDDSVGFKLFARISLLEAEGHHLVLKFLREFGEARLALEFGRPVDLEKMLEDYRGQIDSWERKINKALQEAAELGHPLLLSDAILLRSFIAFNVFTNRRSLTILYGHQEEIVEGEIEGYIGDLNKAFEAYSTAGQLEGQLRAKLLIADFYELVGRQDDARGIAQEVIPKAQIMGYAALIERAQEHLSGQGLQSRINESLRKKTDEEIQIRQSEKTDDELRANAIQMLRILGLPAERVQVMEREYRSVRDLAHERLDWCRHLSLLQNLRHTLHPSTYFRSDPQRVCECPLLGYRSTFPHTDWQVVLRAFKRTYCDGCPERSPLRTENRPEG